MTVTRGGEEWEVPVGSFITVRGPANCSLFIDPPGANNAYETSAGSCSFDLKWYEFETEDDPETKVGIIGCTSTDWNVIPTTAKQCQYGRGMLHVRSGDGGLDLSAELQLEDYVLGISEMPYSWGWPEKGGMEALKVQAIAARSYAREAQMARGNVGNNSCAAWCHVRDSTLDQNYVGWGHGFGYTIDEWIAAVEATAGVVVTHPDAPNEQVVRAFYSSSSGGHTENIEEVWGGDPREYYQSVDDHWAVDGTVYNPNASWTVELSRASVAAEVGLPTVKRIAVTERNTSGSARTVEFSDDTTTVTMSAAWVKSRFGLKSIYFDVILGVFSDIAGSVHADAIVAIYERGITKGCNPPLNTQYCPNSLLTRGQMAAFLTRAFALPPASQDYFVDDASSIFEDDINRLAEARITFGCDTDMYCPSGQITRGQMAAFLSRAFALPPASKDYFSDDNGSVFEGDINRIREAGITFGCNPPDNDHYCPSAPVTRAQMASFIERALVGAGL